MKKYSVKVSLVSHIPDDGAKTLLVEAEAPVQAMKKALLAYHNWDEDWVTPIKGDTEQIQNIAMIVGLVVEAPVEML